ncbi:hypothetical protein AQ1_02391 [alpha proteobacterium Q-1]|nr:hypothetical protein AQ1_02391 [alpha proteobacterium Q-1]
MGERIAAQGLAQHIFHAGFAGTARHRADPPHHAFARCPGQAIKGGEAIIHINQPWIIRGQFGRRSADQSRHRPRLKSRRHMIMAIAVRARQGDEQIAGDDLAAIDRHPIHKPAPLRAPQIMAMAAAPGNRQNFLRCP